MESLFPAVLFLGPYFAPVALRIAAALVFFIHAKKLWGGSFRQRALAAKESLFGILLLIGFLTQLVALAGILVVLGRNIWLGKDARKETWPEAILLIGMLAALFILGAGAFAIDLPY